MTDLKCSGDLVASLWEAARTSDLAVTEVDAPFVRRRRRNAIKRRRPSILMRRVVKRVGAPHERGVPEHRREVFGPGLTSVLT